MEILGFIVVELVLSGLGWLCLMIWYRDREKVEEIRNKKYARRYSAAARIFILNMIAGTGAIAMFGAVLFVLIMVIYGWLTPG